MRADAVDHYLDLRLRGDPEFPQHQLMDALFARLHRALVQLGSTGVGLSFPDASGRRGGLGPRMRLHGTLVALEPLASQSWLVGMRDHVELAGVLEVPASASWISVRRTQAKSNVDRIRRRQMRRRGWTAAEAAAAIPAEVAEMLELPFLTIRSISTRQTFRLFICQIPAPAFQDGHFNSYGLSAAATLPYF